MNRLESLSDFTFSYYKDESNCNLLEYNLKTGQRNKSDSKTAGKSLPCNEFCWSLALNRIILANV
jgi:hypothetical protein